MKSDEIMAKAELQFKKAKAKYEDSIRKANEERGKEEESRKFFIGGLVAKYLREDMKMYFLDLSKEETTRVISYAMKHSDTKRMVNPKYHMLSDYDEKNAFDIAKYIKDSFLEDTKLKMRDDDKMDITDVGFVDVS